MPDTYKAQSIARDVEARSAQILARANSTSDTAAIQSLIRNLADCVNGLAVAIMRLTD
jgi:hypothetical protein